jgi:lambda family phage portal protein
MARPLAIQPRARVPQIIDERGNPIRASARTAHYAADQLSQELAAWYPNSYSADGEWLPEMETIRARVHDFVRNNGMVNGAVQTQIDNLVGSGLRLSAKPDWSYLGVTDPDVAARIEDQIESKFHLWAYDIDRYCDAGRQLTVGGMVAQAVRSVLLSFEAVATGEWLRRPGARYRTAIQMIDPLRLSQPEGIPDSERLRAGIRYDAMGAPVSYFFASRVKSDQFASWQNGLLTWREVPRETPWGRRMVIHVYDQERPGQSRGKGGIVSVLARGRMVDRNERAHLQAAINNAILGTYVTSPMDWRTMAEALGADPDDQVIHQYLENRLEFHKDSYLRFGDSRIPHLYPGEEIMHVQASHPHANFDSFERIFHRYMAAGLNMTYEQFSRDYSQTNYSGHRAALLDYWRFITGRRSLIAGEFATQVYALWLEEAMDRGEIEIPAGAPDFLDAKCAWCRCEWIGPGRGQIDPLKEANATKVDLSNGLTTLEIEAAERGRDWRELRRQTAQELKYSMQLEREFGLPPGSLSTSGPTPVPQPPDTPDERPAQRQEQSA